VDGKCHQVGETFKKDGKVYICAKREANGEPVYENQILSKFFFNFCCFYNKLDGAREGLQKTVKFII
jgi:hypothetical protein